MFHVHTVFLLYTLYPSLRLFKEIDRLHNVYEKSLYICLISYGSESQIFFFFSFLRHVLVKCWKGEQKDAKSTLKSSTLIYVVNLLSLSSDFLKSKVISKQTKRKKLHTHFMCIKNCVYF